MGLHMPIVFYCPELIDYFTFEPVQNHLRQISIVTNNSRVKSYLQSKGIMSASMPVFPKAVIMSRHATHKFPCNSIIQIGLRHGPYHFKRMTDAANYNQFDLYLFSSKEDLKAAEELGVKVGKAVGFPRLDHALNCSYSDSYINDLIVKYHISSDKPTVLFTATWDGSGMSAIEEWADKLHSLTPYYTVLVTIHPWTNKKHRAQILHTPDVYLVADEDVNPVLTLVDLCVGDTSSILAECSALLKPIITFSGLKGKRSLPEIEHLLKLISIPVDNFEQIHKLVPQIIKSPSCYFASRTEANKTMFDTLDGQAGKRAAAEILKLLPELTLTEDS